LCAVLDERTQIIQEGGVGNNLDVGWKVVVGGTLFTEHACRDHKIPDLNILAHCAAQPKHEELPAAHCDGYLKHINGYGCANDQFHDRDFGIAWDSVEGPLAQEGRQRKGFFPHRIAVAQSGKGTLGLDHEEPFSDSKTRYWTAFVQESRYLFVG
jgi:hypothetical protein